MGAGSSGVLGRGEHRRIASAVAAAEDQAGMEFCVYVGRGAESSREHAEMIFAKLDLYKVPGVLLWLSPVVRRVEILTSPPARERVSDEACAAAIEAATDAFATGRYAEGVETALSWLAEAAGPAETGTGRAEMPDIIDE